MGRVWCVAAVLAAELVVLAPRHAAAQVENVAATRHNLSVSGPGPVKALQETQVCVFCHTPHAARPVAPLWNHDTSTTTTYALYQSSTFQGGGGVTPLPSGSSVLCLSCHDGTVALGALRSGSVAMTGTSSGRIEGASNLTTNLRDDHPFSFSYATASAADRWLRATPAAPAVLENSQMQCSSCHEPHVTSTNFLRATWVGGTLCLDCHASPGWGSSSHATSTKPFSGSTVAQTACASCHGVHAARHPVRLLVRDSIETTCYQCHGTASTIAADIQTEIGRAYAHKVNAYEAQHEPVISDPPVEGSPVTSKHVECLDCHDGHGASSASPSGRIQNVMGVSTSGTAVRLGSSSPEYELCFRCHAFGGDVVTGTGDDKYVHFGITAPASSYIDGTTIPKGFHPVVNAGRGDPAVFNSSLSGGLNASSLIRCSDCHASQALVDDSGAVDRTAGRVEGPHGSTSNFLLRGNYTVASCLAILNGQCAPYNSSNGAAFSLCFACHRIGLWTSSSYAFTNFRSGSKNLHRDPHAGKSTGCPECHYDMHSNAHATTHTDFVNIAAGLARFGRQSTHLINFAPSVSGIPSSTRPQWRYDSTNQRFECYLNCHGVAHDPFTYP